MRVHYIIIARLISSLIGYAIFRPTYWVMDNVGYVAVHNKS